MRTTALPWEVVIGLEVHIQLTTQSKIFSTASTAFGAAPNTQTVELDMAMPGTLPVLNRAAVDKAICFGLAVGAQINRKSVFARKNYFYPDLPKGYQISQFEIPIIEHGSLSCRVESSDPAYHKMIRLTRAHLEEDAGKLLHGEFLGLSGIDLNRAGVPLLEVVSEPDMRSAAEAVAYAKALHRIVTWIGLCDGNMQEGSLRFDANVSVRPFGQQALGTRREIKNLNSFRFLEQAINYEMQSQIEELENGRSIEQATVLFDANTGQTRTMRTKEDAHDYRYFPDPDLPPLEIGEDWIERIRAEMVELPDTRQQRFESQYGLSTYDAATLTADRAMADYFEATAVWGADPKLASNWIMGEISAQLHREEKEIAVCPIEPARLAGLIQRLQDHTIHHQSAKTLLRAMWVSAKTADTLIAEQDLKQETDTHTIDVLIDEVLNAYPHIVTEYRSGKDKAFNALVGYCMKAARGKFSPTLVSELLRKKLD